MTNCQPYNEYKDVKLCACMGPQGNDPVCPCAMRRESKTSSYLQWTNEDIKATKYALGQIFKKSSEE